MKNSQAVSTLKHLKSPFLFKNINTAYANYFNNNISEGLEIYDMPEVFVRYVRETVCPVSPCVCYAFFIRNKVTKYASYFNNTASEGLEIDYWFTIFRHLEIYDIPEGFVRDVHWQLWRAEGACPVSPKPLLVSGRRIEGSRCVSSGTGEKVSASLMSSNPFFIQKQR